MINLISIGISDEKLIYPVDEARTVYRTCAKVFASFFDQLSSCCLANCTKETVLGCLGNVVETSSTEDVSLFYFSGHGKLGQDDELVLTVGNSRDGRQELYIKDCLRIFRQNDRRVLLILDCCHSGLAFLETQKKNPNSSGDIYVLASAAFYESQLADTKFSSSLCSALLALQGKSEILFSDLLKELEQRGEVRASHAQGKSDLKLYSENSTSFSFPNLKSFVSRFVSTYNNAPPQEREMLLYSLGSWGHRSVVEVFKRILDPNELMSIQPCWLVRRALGTVLRKNKHSRAGEEIIEALSLSSNWMHSTIALIAERNEKSERHAISLQKILSSTEPMAVKWLAHLYLSEISFDHIECALQCELGQSTWGVFDVYERYSHYGAKEDVLAKIKKSLEQSEAPESLFNSLLLHHSLKYDVCCDERNILERNTLVKLCYQSSNRGREYQVEQKWLLSYLYGDWRGVKIFDVEGYFKNTPPKVIKRELREFGEVPSIEMQAVLLNCMTASPRQYVKYLDCLEWAIESEHPWIKKYITFIVKESEKKVPQLFPLENFIFNPNLTIGFYDYLLRVSPFYKSSDLLDVVIKNDRSKNEQMAFERDIKIIQSHRGCNNLF